ncbi:HAD-IIB family hydrolase [Erysipelotrichaceae bacterium 66-17]
MKMLASDYDGTLYFEFGYRKTDLEAIRQFQKEGNLFGLCSGRPLSNLWDLESDELHFDFIIASSGACISRQPGSIVEEEFLPFEAFERILRHCGPSHMVVITKDTIFVDDLDCWAVRNVAIHPVRLASADQITEDIIQMSIERSTEQEAAVLLDELKELDLACSIFQNGTFLDIVAPDCSKGRGIGKLARHLGLEEKDIACIGDNFNDLPMIETIPDSFSFPYAPEKVQEKAGTIVDSIAQAIECLENEEDHESTDQ